MISCVEIYTDGNVYLWGDNIYRVYFKIDNNSSEDDNRNLYSEVYEAIMNYREYKNIDEHKKENFLFNLADEGFIEWAKEKKEYDDLVFEEISEKDYDNLCKGPYIEMSFGCVSGNIIESLNYY